MLGASHRAGHTASGLPRSIISAPVTPWGTGAPCTHVSHRIPFSNPIVFDSPHVQILSYSILHMLTKSSSSSSIATSLVARSRLRPCAVVVRSPHGLAEHASDPQCVCRPVDPRTSVQSKVYYESTNYQNSATPHRVFYHYFVTHAQTRRRAICTHASMHVDGTDCCRTTPRELQ